MTKIEEKFTHRNLCVKAAKYLKGHGIYKFHKCQYVVCELERAGESPDAFGICSGSTQLIEVKVSRSDFLSDKKKYWRQHPQHGLGKYRSYLCPQGIIKPEDLPEHWGLLWINTDGVVYEVVKPEPQESSHKDELSLLTSIMRREGIAPKIFSYKKYVTDDL